MNSALGPWSPRGPFHGQSSSLTPWAALGDRSGERAGLAAGWPGPEVLTEDTTCRGRAGLQACGSRRSEGVRGGVKDARSAHSLSSVPS